MATKDINLIILAPGTRAAQPAANTVKPGSLYFVTDEGATERSTGAAWQAYSGLGGGGGLTLVEKKILTANASTVTFSGLDGNTHGIYLLTAKIKNVSGTALVYYTLQPNNGTSNQNSNETFFNSATVAGNSRARLFLGFCNANNTWCSFNATIHAKINPNSIVAPILYESSGGNYDGTTRYSWIMAGADATGVNVSSLVVNGVTNALGNVTNGFGDGSQLTLYRYTQ